MSQGVETWQVAYGTFFVVLRVERGTRGIAAAQYEWNGKRKKAVKSIVKSHRTGQIYLRVLPES